MEENSEQIKGRKKLSTAFSSRDNHLMLLYLYFLVFYFNYMFFSTIFFKFSFFLLNIVVIRKDTHFCILLFHLTLYHRYFYIVV